MVVIRLSRIGRKRCPCYKIIVADRRFSRNGRFIEKIGSFDPINSDKRIENLQINLQRLQYWKSHGAKMSRRVFYLMKNIEKRRNSDKL